MSEKASNKLRACVFGASGGIGSALVRTLANDYPDGTIYAGSRTRTVRERMNIRPFSFNLLDEASILKSLEMVRMGGPLDLVVVATGILSEPGMSPEKSWNSIGSEAMQRAFAINTIGPALIAKHCLPLLAKEDRSVFAALSARVGSISDNRLGGWHSYRASKAALNMLIRNFALELQRVNPAAIAVALHPGTVDTGLSEPFQANVPKDKLFTPEFSAQKLIEVIEGLTTADSGKHLAWDKQPIPA